MLFSNSTWLLFLYFFPSRLLRQARLGGPALQRGGSESGISALRLYFLNYIVHLPNPNICLPEVEKKKANADMTPESSTTPLDALPCHHFHPRPMAA